MKNSDLVITTTAEAKPKKNIVQQALCDVAKAARAQPGCIECSIFRSTENPAVTINFERWGLPNRTRHVFSRRECAKIASAVSDAFIESPQPILYEILDEA